MKGSLHFPYRFSLPRIDELMSHSSTSLYTLQLKAKETYGQKA